MKSLRICLLLVAMSLLMVGGTGCSTFRREKKAEPAEQGKRTVCRLGLRPGIQGHDDIQAIPAPKPNPIVSAGEHFEAKLKLIGPDGTPAAGREALVAVFGESAGQGWTKTLTLRSGEDGTISLPADKSGRIEIMLVVRGCGWGHCGLWQPWQENRVTQLRLSPTGSVLGEVRKKDGTPAGGASVKMRTLLPIELTAAGYANPTGYRGNAKVQDMQAAAWPQVPLAAGIRSEGITCDANGRFKLTDMIPGTVPVIVSLAGYETRTDRIEIKAGNHLRYSVELEPGMKPQPPAPETQMAKKIGGAITGRVFDVDANKPVERDMVIALDPTQGELGKGPVTLPVPIHMQLVIDQLNEIFGTWFSEGNLIRLRPVDVERRGFFGLECYHSYSGVDGAFRIENVPEGVYDVVLVRQKWINLIKRGVVVRTGEDTENVNFDVSRSADGFLVGRKLNESGQPLPGLKIEQKYRFTAPGKESEGSCFSGSADAEGCFYCPLVGPGTYDLEETAEGYQPAVLKFEVKDGAPAPRGDFIFRSIPGRPQPPPAGWGKRPERRLPVQQGIQGHEGIQAIPAPKPHPIVPVAEHFEAKLKLIAPDGKPAAGRETLVAVFGEGWTYGAGGDAGRIISSGVGWTKTLRQRTGEDGAITFTEDRGGWSEMVIVVRGCGWTHYGLWHLGDKCREAQLRLSPTGSMGGEVRKSDGTPAAGARVKVRTLLPIELTAKGQTKPTEDSAGAKVLDAASVPWPGQLPLAAGIKSNGITCDENGKFEVADMIPGTWPVIVSLDGFREKTDKIEIKAGDAQTYSAVLEPARITGVVQATDGAPVRGATVSIDDHVYFETGDDGKFFFDECREAVPYTLKVSAPHFKPVRQTVTIPKDNKPLDEIKIVLKDSGGVITGKVFDADDKKPVAQELIIAIDPVKTGQSGKGQSTLPLSGIMALVSDQLQEISGTWFSQESLFRRRLIEVEQKHFFGLECYHAYSGPDGKFSIEDVPEGTYDVLLIRRQWLNLMKHSVTVRKGEDTENVDFNVGRRTPGFLVGRMQDEHDAPLHSLKIELRYRFTAPGKSVEESLSEGCADSEGWYWCKLAGPGKYEMEATADGYQPAVMKFEVKSAEDAPRGDYIFKRLNPPSELRPLPKVPIYLGDSEEGIMEMSEPLPKLNGETVIKLDVAR